jgi:hypothetical protein
LGGKKIYTFTISTDAKELNSGQDRQKDCDPYPNVQVIAPILNSDTGGSDLEG